MPYPNEHAAPQRDASGPDAKIRRYTPETWPEGVAGVWEIDARNNLRLLSVRFTAKVWTVEEARRWLEEHEMAVDGFEAATAEPSGLAEDGFTPPAEVRAAAARGLELRREHGRGGTEVGVARARDLAGGRAVSLETIGRMVSYFARHGAQRPADDGLDTAWRIAWLLWGGDAGRAWANRIWSEHQKMTAEMLLAEEAAPRAPLLPVPEGLTLGRPFATLAVGQVRSRLSGDLVVEVALEDLHELVRVFAERAAHDPVPLDYNHASSPGHPDSGDPGRSGALGLVVGAYVEGERLYVVPAYTAKGLRVLEEHRGTLRSSPEFVLGDVYDRAGEGAVLVGRAQLLAVALTCRPAQVATKIDPVTLTEAASAAGHKEVLMKDEENKGECPRCGAMLAELEALREKCGAYEKKMADAEVKASEGAQKASLAERLGGEVKSLAEQVKSLAERAERAEAAQHRAENEAEAQAYLADGRIAPAEKDAFLAALNERRAGRAMFFEHAFKPRQAGHAVALGEKGHSAPVHLEADGSQEAHKRITEYAAAKCDGDYRAAYKHLSENDPEVRRLLGLKGGK